MKFDNPAIVSSGGINVLGITRNLGRAGIKVFYVTESLNPIVFAHARSTR